MIAARAARPGDIGLDQQSVSSTCVEKRYGAFYQCNREARLYRAGRLATTDLLCITYSVMQRERQVVACDLAILLTAGKSAHNCLRAFVCLFVCLFAVCVCVRACV